MRSFGFVLLLLGFLLIVVFSLEDFTMLQHTHWIQESKHLGDIEVITHDDASTALRSLALKLKDAQRVVLLPATMMLAGGCCLFFAYRPSKSQRK